MDPQESDQILTQVFNAKPLSCYRLFRFIPLLFDCTFPLLAQANTPQEPFEYKSSDESFDLLAMLMPDIL